MTSEINSESWRSISGYSNYQVSNIGRIRNSSTWIILKPDITKDGYYRINLYKNKTRRHHRIHRLVAEEWVLNPDKKPFVDHINHNKSDNTEKSSMGFKF